jgi:hypothetical protein
MTDRPRDWFSIEHKFTVNNTEELFAYLRAASFLLLEEADIDYDITANKEPELGRSMLENIGVKCNAKSR